MTMLRDNKEAERQLSSHNVLGEPPEICSMRPMTGFYRDGCCKYRTRRCWQPRWQEAFETMPPVLRERGCLVLLLTRRSQTPSH